MANSTIPVRDVMISPVITIGTEGTVKKAANIMMKNDIGGLVVVDKDKKPVGMITERDFVTLLAKKKNPRELSVKQVMSSPIIAISPDESIVDAADIIIKTKKRKLPVVEKGKLVGIITADDIARVAPEELRILRELVKMKEIPDGDFTDSITEGECELCGNYANQLFEVNEQYICEDCKKNSGED